MWSYSCGLFGAASAQVLSPVFSTLRGVFFCCATREKSSIDSTVNKLLLAHKSVNTDSHSQTTKFAVSSTKGKTGVKLDEIDSLLHPKSLIDFGFVHNAGKITDQAIDEYLGKVSIPYWVRITAEIPDKEKGYLNFQEMLLLVEACFGSKKVQHLTLCAPNRTKTQMLSYIYQFQILKKDMKWESAQDLKEFVDFEIPEDQVAINYQQAAKILIFLINIPLFSEIEKSFPVLASDRTLYWKMIHDFFQADKDNSGILEFYELDHLIEDHILQDPGLQEGQVTVKMQLEFLEKKLAAIEKGKANNKLKDANASNQKRKKNSQALTLNNMADSRCYNRYGKLEACNFKLFCYFVDDLKNYKWPPVYEDYKNFRKLKKEDFDEFVAVFKSIDVDNSKKISHEELSKLFEKLKSGNCSLIVPQFTEQNLKEIIKILDVDQDGTINFTELLTFLYNFEHYPKEAFDQIFDLNHNGQVELHEFRNGRGF